MLNLCPHDGRRVGLCPVAGYFEGDGLMLRQIWWGAAGVLPFAIVATSWAVAGAAPPAARNPAAERLPADAARMYGFVKVPHPGELRWQQIPWLTDLQDGIRQAKSESRPLVLFASGDDPLEKC
jgi:hypothetical protein